jgi:hypothetical protein
MRSWLCLLLLAVAGCGRQPGFGTESATGLAQNAGSKSIDLPGWRATGDQETYGYETLYNLVNGQADAFFAYGFQDVAVQRYANAEEAELRIRLWKLATPADAYGLYTSGSSGVPVPVGNGGHVDEGRYLAFWQDHYYVELFAIPALAHPGALQDLARAVSARLPTGGELPALLDHLPPEGIEPGRTVFFHEEISIQDYLWLGGENLLGLSPETEGVLARYDLGGDRAQLLIVRYPTEEGASAGRVALEDSDLAPVTVREQGSLLGAVFGEIGAPAAESLLASALEEP